MALDYEILDSAMQRRMLGLRAKTMFLEAIDRLPKQDYQFSFTSNFLNRDTLSGKCLYASKKTAIHFLKTTDGMPVAAKIFLKHRLCDNEEPVNPLNVEYGLLLGMKGYGSFVFPYGMGTALDTQTDEKFEVLFEEYVSGMPFDDALSMRITKTDYVNNVAWFDQISHQLCGAVGHLHANNIVHRDLSGGNILVDENGNVRIIDFGIAKKLTAWDQKLLLTTKPIATPDIAPPEEFRGEISLKTDPYAIGMHHLQWLMGTTNPDAIFNTISALYAGSRTIRYGPQLTELLERQTLDSLSKLIQQLLAYKPEDRLGDLLLFREKFAFFLRQDRGLFFKHV